MNPGNASFGSIAFLMFLSGIGIPILATWNSQLGVQLSSPVAATFIMFTAGFVLASIVLVATGGFPSGMRLPMDRPYLYFSVVFMLFYALSITWAAPRIGIGNSVFFVLIGQLVAAAIIDHFGLWGALKSTLTLRRAAGIAVMALGVYLARKPV